MGAPGLSYTHGASIDPLVGDTLGVHFARAARRWGDREAIVMRHQNVRLSFNELASRVDAFAAGLLSLGLAPGDRIGIWATNCIEWVITQHATSRAGLIQVNLDPAYREAEIEYALNKVGCKALITMDRFRSSDYLSILRKLMPEIDSAAPGELQAQRVPSLRTLIRIGAGRETGFLPFDEVAPNARAEHHAELLLLQDRLQCDDAINIQFTSGTTGAPKATTLSHHTLLNNALALGHILGVREGDRLCRTGPLFHIMGTTASLYTLSAGATLVFPAPTFDARVVLQAIAEERCTHLGGVPTMFVILLNLPEFSQYDLTSLRAGTMGGSPCPPELMQRVIKDMHLEGMIITYGMTETGPTSMCTRPDDSFERRVDSIGQAFPHTEVRIVDADGRTVPCGTPGELCVRGFTVMKGYWNDPESTAAAIDASGWMHTGDLATLDEDGYGRIVGRIKEMVIRGGENIFPREIEVFLNRHPAVADTQVFGVPDAKYGEELCAWIVPKEGQDLSPEAVREFCQGSMAHYKVPRHIRVVSQFPVNATGKAQKRVMRDQMTRELGLESTR